MNFGANQEFNPHDSYSDDPTCYVCGQKPKGKKIWVVIKKGNFDEPLVCVCEQCVYRLPYDLQPKMIRKRFNPTSTKVILDALKNTKKSIKLNKGFCALLEGSPMHEFHKFDSKHSFNKVKESIPSLLNPLRKINALYKDGTEIDLDTH